MMVMYCVRFQNKTTGAIRYSKPAKAEDATITLRLNNGLGGDWFATLVTEEEAAEEQVDYQLPPQSPQAMPQPDDGGQVEFEEMANG